VIGLRTLVLNSNYMPISAFPLHTIPAEDAVTRVCNDTCRVVFEYDRRILTPTHVMRWPAVIARTDTKSIEEGVKLKNESLFYRDHGRCAYCERAITMSEMTCDHVIPKSRGGQYEWTNIVSSCPSCNSLKGDSDPVGRWRPRSAPIKPTYYQLLDARRRYPITVDDASWVPFLGTWRAPVYVRSHG